MPPEKSAPVSLVTYDVERETWHCSIDTVTNTPPPTDNDNDPDPPELTFLLEASLDQERYSFDITEDAKLITLYGSFSPPQLGTWLTCSEEEYGKEQVYAEMLLNTTKRLVGLRPPTLFELCTEYIVQHGLEAQATHRLPESLMCVIAPEEPPAKRPRLS